jgi:hypothetical protein
MNKISTDMSPPKAKTRGLALERKKIVAHLSLYSSVGYSSTVWVQLSLNFEKNKFVLGEQKEEFRMKYWGGDISVLILFIFKFLHINIYIKYIIFEL